MKNNSSFNSYFFSILAFFGLAKNCMHTKNSSLISLSEMNTVKSATRPHCIAHSNQVLKLQNPLLISDYKANLYFPFRLLFFWFTITTIEFSFESVFESVYSFPYRFLKSFLFVIALVIAKCNVWQLKWPSL